MRAKAIYGALAAMCVACVAAAFAQVASETPTKDAYIFSYFCGQSDGLHLAVSDDGLNWTALNGNKSVLKPTVGKDRLMRDPSICRRASATVRSSWCPSTRKMRSRRFPMMHLVVR